MAKKKKKKTTKKKAPEPKKKSSSSSKKTELSSSEKKKLETNLKTLQKTLDTNKNVSASQKKEIQKQIDSIKKEVGGSSTKKEKVVNDEEDDTSKFKDDDGDGKNDDVGFYDDSSLRATDEFKALNGEDQQAVLAVFGAVAGNDKVQADRLAKAFAASSKINDPYFAQQLRLAQDAIVRGYVSIDEEAAFSEMQMRNRLSDLKVDYENKRQYLNAEQASVFKDIERTYTENLQSLQSEFAASGRTNSSERAKKEAILNDATGDLRESTNRKFGFEQRELLLSEQRSDRDTQLELARLNKLTTEGKLDFLRKAEAQVGSKNLPTLNGAPAALGGIYGSLPEEKLRNTIDAAKSFVF